MMFCVFGVVEAQTRMRKSEIERIKRDTAYFFGENSLASTQEEAFELSMASLYQDIVGKCNADAIYLGSGSQREQLLKIIETFAKQHEDEESDDSCRDCDLQNRISLSCNVRLGRV